MKILIIDTYYPELVKRWRAMHPQVAHKSYSVQLQLLLQLGFGTADFYSHYFNRLGYQARDTIVNDEVLQKMWAQEHRLQVSSPQLLDWARQLPYVYRFLGRPCWIQEIALAQVRELRPDIVYVQDLSILNPKTLVEIKKLCRLLVGQIASPLPSSKYLHCYGLIISSLPNLVNQIKRLGIASEYLPLAFDPRVWQKIGPQAFKYDVTFIGSFTPHHQRGIRTLEKLAREVPVQVWGHGIKYLSPVSPLRQNYHGQLLWGRDMFRTLAESRIVVNRHISIANGYANNMRLYETTGMGALLITESKKNLKELFRVNQEVVAYTNYEDLVKKVKYYLRYESKRVAIARAGQKRTLVSHSYPVRIKQLEAILKKYL